MAFENVEKEKQSEVWKSFWLKKVENKTRCHVYFDNGVNTIYNVQSRSSVI